MKFTDYEEAWEKRFIEINNKKPNRLERISWGIGFSAGTHFEKDKQSSDCEGDEK